MVKIRPFRFSCISNGARSREELITQAKKSEEVGVSTFLMTDHFDEASSFGIVGDPISTLMAVADATSLRIGSHVFCNDFYHPAVLYRQVAMLDQLSEGRFQFGLGCGYLAEDYKQAGLPFDRVGVRIARFEESVKLYKAYFQTDKLYFAGQHYTLDGLDVVVKSVQKPYPPLYLGGGGKRILSFAAREADVIGLAAKNNEHGLNWTSSLYEYNDEKLTWIREAAGERFEHIELSNTIFIAVVTNDREHVAYGVGQKLGLTPEQTLQCNHVLIGTIDQMVEELYYRREHFGFSSIEFRVADIGAVAPVIGQLAGR
ncbi:TIGR03621 family F420-dependent LLM class oxidoreductase [Tengunoibacter tsumagoiensis]|uniref:LLM class F420-dependent oxidoreductase n=1 Tax=Tengunoibacter tsumagoiensis TaxID=2014871 RepID=A0A402A9Z5_9CHLR|nr:TIGR03621 family F420-dependent LLM class oxidoreductase [Tengunoibacter tsumagoiensis]GCE16004.1 LLM class F420-dependent oxidoreductase [Tengunoibacter tsumagoiensis]